MVSAADHAFWFLLDDVVAGNQRSEVRDQRSVINHLLPITDYRIPDHSNISIPRERINVTITFYEVTAQ